MLLPSGPELLDAILATKITLISFVIIVYSGILLIVGLAIFAKYLLVWARTPEFGYLGRPIGLLDLCYLVAISLGAVEQLQTWFIPVIFNIRLPYILYFSEVLLFVSGAFLLVRRSGKIPKERDWKLIRAQIVLLLVAFLLLLVIVLASPRTSLDVPDLLMDIIALSGIFYLIHSITIEIDTNPSYLTRARLSLVRYSIWMIFGYTLFVTIDAIVRVAGSILMKDVYFYVVISKAPQSIFAFVALLFASWSLTLPGWIRKRYGLEEERFSKFVQDI